MGGLAAEPSTEFLLTALARPRIPNRHRAFLAGSSPVVPVADLSQRATVRTQLSDTELLLKAGEPYGGRRSPSAKRDVITARPLVFGRLIRRSRHMDAKRTAVQ
jgi:hypothetical protein